MVKQSRDWKGKSDDSEHREDKGDRSDSRPGNKIFGAGGRGSGGGRGGGRGRGSFRGRRGGGGDRGDRGERGDTRKFPMKHGNMRNDMKGGAMKNACYRCRNTGHKLADCPQADLNTMNVCYKCGSTEHKLFECKSSKPGLDFARCFICSEEGHISRDCPQNSRGAYPRGGSCKICESVHHFARDCPENGKSEEQEEEEEVTVDTMGENGSADAQDFIPIKRQKKPKVVSF